jgi:outer membrane protein assembly factor BamB
MKKRWALGSRFSVIALTTMLCLGLAPPAVGREQAARGAPQRQAELILEASGVTAGLIVHLGCGDGRLTGALHANEACLVQGLDADPANLARIRAYLQELGLYGKVAADSYDGRRLPYIDNVVNLLVVQDASSVNRTEMLRVLCPDGVAVLLDAELSPGDVLRKPRPAEIDAWTHFLHGADGNAVADDTIVDAPYHLQWAGGPRYARTHEGVSTVNVAVSDGKRIYYVADDAPVALPDQIPTRWALVARDAFNGVVLWKVTLGRWQARSAGSRHLFPPDLFRRLVAGERRVFATLDILGPVVAIDSTSGDTVRVFEETEGTEEILYDKGVLYLAVNPAPAEAIDRGLLAREWPLTEPKELIAVEAETGRPLWRKNDRDTIGVAPLSTAVRDGKLVFLNPREVVCLDAASGEIRWRTERRSPETRPPWGTPTLVIADGVVLCADCSDVEVGAEKQRRRGPEESEGDDAAQATEKTRSELVAYDANDGRPLWSTPCEEGSHVPNEIFVVDGLVWVGEQPGRSKQDYRTGRDLRTGEVKRTLPLSDDWVGHHHHRCYRDKATSRFILAGRTGVEFIDVASGQLSPHHWIRGICKFGVLPCNGLLYVPPNQCSCYQESLLNGFNALAPKESRVESPELRAEERLQRGPAYGNSDSQLSTLNPQLSHDWPTYRGDAARSGSTPQRLPTGLKTSWSAEISGRLTAPIVSGGKVYVAAVDRHTVYALDLESGSVRWRYTAGGRIDSPPTASGGFVVFGCRDGWVYALRAADGALVWRRLAAPCDERLVADGQCESVWPVHGSVLIEDGRVYFAAGRSSNLDGGVACSVVDLASGQPLAERRHYSRSARTGGQESLYQPFAGALLPDRELPGVLPDVPASDGRYVFLRSVAFDREFNPADQYVPHLFAAAGFVDDDWYQRLFWIYGNHLFSGLAGRGFNKSYPSVGRILVHDQERVYGYRDYTLDNEGVFAVDKTAGLGVFDSEFPPAKGAMKGGKRDAKGSKAESGGWRLDVPFYVRAMVATGDGLLLAGPPKHEPEAVRQMIASRPIDTEPLPPLLEAALAAWQGERGGWLWAVDKQSGAKFAEYPLPSPPVHDGMAVAQGRLVLCTMQGQVLCLAK